MPLKIKGRKALPGKISIDSLTQTSTKLDPPTNDLFTTTHFIKYYNIRNGMLCDLEPQRTINKGTESRRLTSTPAQHLKKDSRKDRTHTNIGRSEGISEQAVQSLRQGHGRQAGQA